MTPAEFHAVMEARCKNKQQDLGMLDALNAKLCEIIVKAPYLKDPTERTMKSFLISDQDDTVTVDMSPEAIMDRAFANLAKTGGE
jgi:hypothetical protein